MNNKENLHTILGAGGSIGNPLAKTLLDNNQKVRLVSRSNYEMMGAESYKADITDLKQTMDAVKGSSVVYLAAGIKYQLSVWEEFWPKIMMNVIEACKSTGSKLIFLDNVYMYGKVTGQMTEETPYNPCSKKGEVRAAISRKLEEEYKKGNLNAIIARAADLYGPYADKNSLPYIMIFDKQSKGKNAQWLVNANTVHTYSYTLDCANAIWLLSQDEQCNNQIWHMPSANPGISAKEFISISAKLQGLTEKYSVLPKFMVQLVGLFDKQVKEIIEMSYQVEYDYKFNSDKFNNYFNYKPKPYNEGIRETLEYFKFI